MGAAASADRCMRLCWLRHPATGRVLDQAMVVVYPDGSSYTGEEAAEIFCHGGPAVIDSIVSAAVDLGAVRAGPGDFTRRAVAAGRIDLVQAEAVALLSSSTNESSIDIALHALAGHPSGELQVLSGRLLDYLAECEASLDFDESDEIYVDLRGLSDELLSCVSLMDTWIRDARAVDTAVSGFKVVLSGAPNAGKSTLMNALAGRDVAIVHDTPGTTRDVVSERVILAGVPCILSDTAGIRPDAGEIEAEGVRRAIRAASQADLVLSVFDSTQPFNGLEPVRAGMPDIEPRAFRDHALVITKSDLSGSRYCQVADTVDPVFVVSGLTGAGVSQLRDFIAARAVDSLRRAAGVSAVVAGDRQVATLTLARDRLAAGVGHLRDGAPQEIVAACIRDAVGAIGGITGAAITEEVLDRIFSRFCIGK